MVVRPKKKKKKKKRMFFFGGECSFESIDIIIRNSRKFSKRIILFDKDSLLLPKRSTEVLNWIE